MKYRIGDAIVDFDANRIERADRSVELEPRVADVLRYLIQHAGQVVTREALLDRVWNTQNISDDAITRCINLIRRSFDDNPREPRVLQTLTKRGYRLIADVQALDGADVDAKGAIVVRLNPEQTLTEIAAACFIGAGASLMPRIEAFLTVDMTRVSASGGETHWRGRTYSASVRKAENDMVLRVRRSSFTSLLPPVAALIGFALAWMTLRGVGAGSQFALPSGQVIAGAVFAALAAGGIAWLWKDRLDNGAADDVANRRDAILAAILRE